MSNPENSNTYTVCIIYDKHNREIGDFILDFKKLEKEDNDILFIRGFGTAEHKDKKDNSYIACVKKYINDDYSANDEYIKESGIVIKRSFPQNTPLGINMTWGFFIKTDKIDPQNVIDIFINFENHGFIKKNSYQIVFPQPYPNGDDRKYLIVTFDKINNAYPRKFIRKLKLLLHNTCLNNEYLKVSWLSNSVAKDIKKGEVKNFKAK